MFFKYRFRVAGEGPGVGRGVPASDCPGVVKGVAAWLMSSMLARGAIAEILVVSMTLTMFKSGIAF